MSLQDVSYKCAHTHREKKERQTPTHLFKNIDHIGWFLLENITVP